MIGSSFIAWRRTVSTTIVAAAVVGQAAADEVGTAIAYQGRLKTGGMPADGAYDMNFRLYNAVTAGSQVGPAQVNDGTLNPVVDVQDGLFTVKLDFGAVFDGTAMWLEIDVRPDNVGSYTTLSPRQPFCATPYALYALNGPGVGDSYWIQNGSDLHYDAGNVGIGAPIPEVKLHVAGTIQSRGGATNRVAVFNPNPDSISANFDLSWLDDVARIRYGGNGIGSQNGFAIQGQGDVTKLRLLNNGNLGLGDDDPQAKLHVRTSDLALLPEALENDEVIVEAQDAALGLYSTGGGDWASAIALKEISNGAVVDTWGIVRRPSTTTLPSSLRFTYGTNSNYASNPSFLSIDKTGNVGIGIDQPAVRLHAQGSIRSSRADGAESNQFVQLLANSQGNYVHALSREGAKEPLFVQNLHDGTGSPAGNANVYFTVGSVAAPTTAFLIQETGSVHFNSNVAGDEQVGITGKLRIYSDDETRRLQAWVGTSGAVIDAENGHLQLRVGSTDRIFVNNPSGNVGIGTSTVAEKLTVAGNVRANGDLLCYNGTLASVHLDSTSNGGGRAIFRNSLGNTTVDIEADISDAGCIEIKDNTVTTITLDANYQGSGSSRIIADVLQINGADLSEQFDVSGDSPVEPGMVVSIDPANPGKLAISAEAYDKKVAGIISGAGGVRTGLVMGQAGTLAHGEHAVALTGRVWCFADASLGAIAPGDLLTTSSTPGHAMRATDAEHARGAVIGKAMTGLVSGKGMVLVLVQPQ